MNAHQRRVHLELFASGDSIADIERNYTFLTEEDLRQAVGFAVQSHKNDMRVMSPDFSPAEWEWTLARKRSSSSPGRTVRGRRPSPDRSCPRFINADLIAAGLSPFAPEAAALRAGRLMLQEMDACERSGSNFAIETTLSGLNYLGRIRRWRAGGYHVNLYFLTLPDVEIAVARVAERVRQGGHDVPEAVIRRRFDAGLHHFDRHYRQAVDAWMKFDNSGVEPVLLNEGTNP